MVNLSPYNGGSFGVAGTLSGSINLTPSQRDEVLAGQTYVNIHTSANPGGELRGQIAPVLMVSGLGSQNVRATALIAPGSGHGLIALVGSRVFVNVGYRDLTGSATAAHIHGPAGTGSNGDVLFNLGPFNGGAFGSAGGLSGSAAQSASVIQSLIDQLTYINIHTAANGGGEIRGQIVR